MPKHDPVHKRLVRLAHEHPELRKDILPLLRRNKRARGSEVGPRIEHMLKSVSKAISNLELPRSLDDADNVVDALGTVATSAEIAALYMSRELRSMMRDPTSWEENKGHLQRGLESLVEGCRRVQL